VELAVHTGVSFREWLTDPAAMVTAAEILAEAAEAMDKAVKR
jgi:hypothetical protein